MYRFDFSKKYWLLLIVVFALGGAIVPWAINFLYSVSDYFPWTAKTVWDANAAIQAYCSLLGSIVTIVGVMITVKEAQKQYTRELHDKVTPRLVLIPIINQQGKEMPEVSGAEEVRELFPTTDKELEEPVGTFSFDRVRFLVSIDRVEYRNRFTRGEFEGKRLYGKHLVITPPVFCEFILRNVGLGAAINTTVRMVKEEGLSSKDSAPATLLTNGDIKIEVLFVSEEVSGDFTLECAYKDVYGEACTCKFLIVKKDNTWVIKED